jgi:CHAD domain-containing protein
MFEFLTPILASVIGAGAGSMFNRVFSKSSKFKRLPLPEETQDVRKALHELHVWEEQVEDAIEAQQRQITRLRKEIRATRYLLDVFLILLLAACLAYYWLKK